MKKPARNGGADLSAIIVAAKAGDQKAFGQLIEATQNRLFRFCVTLTADKSLAEDLCQEAYLKVFSRLGDLEKPDAFIDWLFRITKNIFLDQMRSPVAKETSLDEQTLEMQRAEDRDWAEILSIHQAMSQFEPEDRWLLMLVDLEERSYSEAGDIMGISEDAVRSRLFRLRKIFLEKWNKPETK